MDFWEKMYELAKEYYSVNKDLNIPTRYVTKDGERLGAWISNQRRRYKENKLSQTQINLLNEIEMIWEKENHPWNEMYWLAKNYYRHHQTLKIKRTFKTKNGYEYDENGINLGLWISNQRNENRKNKLSKERKEKLEKIGMMWNAQQDNWYKMYDLAKNYYNYYKNLRINSFFKTKDGINYDEKGESLGNWIRYQRQLYNSAKIEELTPYKIKLLNEIEMIWSIPKKKEEDWEEMYDLAQKYYKFHQKLNIPINFKTINGYEYDKKGKELGLWLKIQRRHYNAKDPNNYYANYYNPLTKEKEERLNQIAMIWNIHDYKWYNNYELARNYYLKNNNLNIPTNFKTKDGINYDKNGINLYSWINRQKTVYKNKNQKDIRELTQNQIDLLNELNIRWENTPEKKWEEMYELAKVYYTYHKNLDIIITFKTINGFEYDEKGKHLGTWIKNQRSNYKQKKLSQDRINLLESIGMIWNKTKRKNKYKKININKNIESDLAYQELVAKINLLKILNAPLLIDGKPHPLIYMTDRELRKNYNISLEDLIYNFYDNEISEGIKTNLSRGKVLTKRFK